MRRYPAAEFDKSLALSSKNILVYSPSGRAITPAYSPTGEAPARKSSVVPMVIYHIWDEPWSPFPSKPAKSLGRGFGISHTQLRFQTLVAEWKEATDHLSATDEIAMHPAYQQIIGMGSDALPLILEELRQRGGYWYWALKAITGDDPVPETDRGKVPLMKKAWLKWAEDRGL